MNTHWKIQKMPWIQRCTFVFAKISMISAQARAWLYCDLKMEIYIQLNWARNYLYSLQNGTERFCIYLVLLFCIPLSLSIFVSGIFLNGSINTIALLNRINWQTAFITEIHWLNILFSLSLGEMLNIRKIEETIY